MSVRVVGDACDFNGGRAVVVLEGDNPEEVTNMTAKNLAMKTATKLGFPVRGISGTSGPFVAGDTTDTVNGKVITVEEMNKMSEQAKYGKYWNEFYLVSQALVP